MTNPMRDALRAINAIRPYNWMDADDPEMVAAWRMVDAALAQADTGWLARDLKSAKEEVSQWPENIQGYISGVAKTGGEEWQPIETAPKDGRTILIGAAGPRVCAAFWMNDWYGDKSLPGWMMDGMDEEYGSYKNPTHWMPLPAPPTAKTGDGE